MGAGYNLSLSLNDTYTSEVPTSTFAVFGQKPVEIPSINILNASAAISRDAWSVGIYATNLLNKYQVLSRSPRNPPLAYTEGIGRPREVYLRAGYSF